MNIVYAKFFQPVTLCTGPNTTTVVTHAGIKDYRIVLDGNFVKVQHISGGPVVLVNYFNTAFLRTDCEDINASPETSRPNTGGKKKESN